MDSNSLTTREVARLCRVSDATVKRWELAGLIKSERTNGGHRRFRATEIARFQQDQNLGVRQNARDESIIQVKKLNSADKNLSDCTFFYSLVAGCEETAANRLINEYLNGISLTEIFDGLICSTMNHIGELWYQGKLSVAQEHLATRTVLSAMHELRKAISVGKSRQKLVICCAFEGDFHELPTYLAQMTFESEGWEVMNFGANTPLFSLTEEIEHHSPDMICISSTMMENIERSVRDYKDFIDKNNKRKFKIILGGHTFQDSKIHSRFPADFYPNSFGEVFELAIKHPTKN